MGWGVGAVAVVGGGGLLVEDDVLPGRTRLHELLGLNGADAPLPHASPGPRVNGSFVSRARGGVPTGWSVSYPPGHPVGSRLPVLVSLHGAGASHTSSFDTLGLDRFLALAVAAGVAPFAIASVDGGAHSYWHRRADGSDAGAMVAEEFVPLLARRGLDTGRLGLYGWSMGGYGALLLAGQGKLAVRAVAVSSPALFEAAGATAAGAYDDAADFDAHDVFAHPEWLSGTPLMVDCGTGDPFYQATRDYVSRLHPKPAGGFQPGAHTPGYWRRVAPAQLKFIGAQLA
ncbi:MAG: hypothetical protein JWR35_1743 [Marmoricola sp.]|nr:hypothetical protein [Marmoricola sp.]